MIPTVVWILLGIVIVGIIAWAIWYLSVRSELKNADIDIPILFEAMPVLMLVLVARHKNRIDRGRAFLFAGIVIMLITMASIVIALVVTNKTLT